MTPSSHRTTRLISFVVPCFNEAPVLQIFADRMSALCDEISKRFEARCEVLLIDDGSHDQTWHIIRSITIEDPRFIGHRLATNRGQQQAILEGYRIASGHAVITLDADLQDPPELSLDMLRAFERGSDLVIARRSTRHTDHWGKRLTAYGFYRMMAWLGLDRRAMNCGEFRLMSRRCMHALIEASGPVLFHRYTVTQLGFTPEFVDFGRPERAAGETKYSYRQMLLLAWSAVRVTRTMPHGTPKLTSGIP